MMIAENLKKLRNELGLSVAKMADKLEMSANTLTNYERETRIPNATLFVQLNKINVNLNWLVSGQGNMFNQPAYEEIEDKLEEKILSVMKKYGVVEK